MASSPRGFEPQCRSAVKARRRPRDIGGTSCVLGQRGELAGSWSAADENLWEAAGFSKAFLTDRITVPHRFQRHTEFTGDGCHGPGARTRHVSAASAGSPGPPRKV